MLNLRDSSKASSTRPQSSTTVASPPPSFGSGYFTAPSFTLDGQVHKTYSGDISRVEAERLETLHASFIADLSGIGIKIPETKIEFRPHGERFQIHIFQKAFGPHELARNILESADADRAFEAARLIAGDALRFLTSPLAGQRGFHPSFRNYAIRDGEAFMFDTFPPYASRAETHQMMIQHAPVNPRLRPLLKCGKVFLRLYSSEYYEPLPMLGGIVATVQRRRPELGDLVKSFILEKAYETGLHETERLREYLEGYQADRWRFKLDFLMRWRNISR